MTLAFEHLWALLILLLALPLAWMARRSVAVLGRWKSYGGLTLRLLVLLLLTVALARPSLVRESDAMSVLVVADESDSIPIDLRKQAEAAVRGAVDRKERPEDRVGVVTVARDAIIAAMPAQLNEVVLTGHVGELQATDLAAGLGMALATHPADTTARVLLLSDGNETSGSLMEAADRARAAGIPIDVVPLEYQHADEVLIESLRAPTRAREGQSIDLRVVLRSQKPAQGRLLLWQNDEPIDLDPDSNSLGFPVDLKAGPNLITLPVVANGTGAQRFRVVFEPADPAQDSIGQNNTGAAVVFVGGTGRVLIIEAEGGTETDALERALRDGKIEVERASADTAMGRGLSYLAGFDCVVLANVPRWAMDNTYDRALHAYAHDLGGGLVMLGGPESFGAGGWLGSETAKALPVRMDPPQTRQILRGALAILLHSCEMAEGNYWGQKVAESAINALSSQDYIGMLSYGGGGFGSGPRPGDRENYGWGLPMQLAGDKRVALAAAKGMMVGDMPGFQIPLEMVHDEMIKLRAGQKHAIVITDGDPGAPAPELLNDFKANKITVTTVMVGGHGTAEDNRKMQAIANKTGGRFYKVDNPRKLPEIFIQEATLVSRSLIVEGDFQPGVAISPGGPTAGFDGVPPLRGYILTVPREGLAQMPVAVKTSEGTDPIFAYWNYGLGRSIAFTSDLGPRWGAAWTRWGRFQAFWEQSIRWTMRPAMPQDVSVSTRVDGDRAFVDVETREQQGGFAATTRAEARLVAPDGTVTDLPLRQTGPGRFSGEFPTTQSGAYLTNVSFARATADGQARAGSVQAAISVPYAAEYRATRDNSALLRAIAERTGGRVLRLADAKTWELFDRTDLGVSQSARKLWDLSAIIAAVLILLDIAWRRIAFDRRDAQDLAARVTGGAVSAGAGGMDALRRARTGAAAGASGGGASGAPGAPGTPGASGTPTIGGRPATDADPALKARRFEASANDPKIDARTLGDAGDAGPGRGAPKPRPDAGGADAPAEDALARLRAARQRARKQQEGEGPDSPGAPGAGSGGAA